MNNGHKERAFIMKKHDNEFIVKVDLTRNVQLFKELFIQGIIIKELFSQISGWKIIHELIL